MGRGGRVCFVLLPVLLNIAALVVLLFVFTGNTSTSGPTSNLYWVKITTSDFQLPAELGVSLDLKDWYTLGLWNYCTGNAGSDKPLSCSDPKAFFWFDPVSIWNLDSGVAAQLLSSDAAQGGLSAYKAASRWLFIAYIGAIGATAAAAVVSFCAFWRRLGSVVTTVVALAAALFAAAGAITASVIYPAVVNFVNSGLLSGTPAGLNTGDLPPGADQYIPDGAVLDLSVGSLDAQLGRTMFALAWLGAGLSAGACIFFLLTACCCKGGDRGDRRSRSAEKSGPSSGPQPWMHPPSQPLYAQPQTKGWGAGAYERVPSPYAAQDRAVSPPAAGAAHAGTGTTPTLPNVRSSARSPVSSTYDGAYQDHGAGYASYDPYTSNDNTAYHGRSGHHASDSLGYAESVPLHQYGYQGHHQYQDQYGQYQRPVYQRSYYYGNDQGL